MMKPNELKENEQEQQQKLIYPNENAFESVYWTHGAHFSDQKIAIFTHPIGFIYTYTHTRKKKLTNETRKKKHFLDAERMKSKKILFFYCLLTIRVRIHTQHNTNAVYVCVYVVSQTFEF